MQYFSQYDPKWAHVKLGSSKLTLGRWGCTTTAICELARRWGSKITPEEYAHNAANYTKDGLVIWQAVQKTIPEMEFMTRQHPAQETYIGNALKDKNSGVLLEVNNGAHWVLATSRTLLGNDYIAIDPWGGTEIKVKAKYKNITKAVYFSRVETKPTKLPQELEHLSGRILLAVEQRGRLYYVTKDGKKHDLGGSPKAIQEKLASMALGISNEDLAKIPE